MSELPVLKKFKRPLRKPKKIQPQPQDDFLCVRYSGRSCKCVGCVVDRMENRIICEIQLAESSSESDDE